MVAMAAGSDFALGVDSVWGVCARAAPIVVSASATPARIETEVRTLSACCGSSFIVCLQSESWTRKPCGAPRLAPSSPYANRRGGFYSAHSYLDCASRPLQLI